MSSLDQSLDEIIGAKKAVAKKQTPKQGPKKSAPQKVGKNVNTNRRAGAKPVKASAIPVTKGLLDASYATKVNVMGLPKDIKQDAVKDFFASQIGNVSHVVLSYNERGQSTGVATVMFKNASAATKAVEKYNGAPIDGGSTKLRLELIVDPTKRPLAARIVANALEQSKKGGRGQPAKATQARGPAKQQAKAKPAQQPKKDQPKKEKKKRPSKKTLEELDQEMTDYFEEQK